MTLLYLNDVNIKGPKLRYNNKKVLNLSEVRKFIIKHI
jgi:hypothetical protein